MNTKLKEGKRILSKKLTWDFTLKGLEKTYTLFLQEMGFNSELLLERDGVGVKVVLSHKTDQFNLEIFYLSEEVYVKHTHILFKQETKNMIINRECFINKRGFSFDIDKVAKEIISRVRECWSISLG